MILKCYMIHLFIYIYCLKKHIPINSYNHIMLFDFKKDQWPQHMVFIWFYKPHKTKKMVEKHKNLICMVNWLNYSWLVFWNMSFIFPYIGNNFPNWLSYFSKGLKPPTRQQLAIVHDIHRYLGPLRREQFHLSVPWCAQLRGSHR